MTGTATRRAELNKYNSTARRAMDDTVRKYREACAEILPAVKEQWNEISQIKTEKEKQLYISLLKIYF